MTARRRTGALPAVFAALTAVLAIVLTVGCTEEPQELLEADYTEWERTTEATLDFTVPGHGSGLRRIYADDAVMTQSLDGAGAVHYPAGATLIKEVYSSPSPSSEETPEMLVGMVKAPEDPRSRGGWIWVVRDPTSGDETIFEDEFCVTCHSNANEPHPYGSGNPENAFRDYVFHTPAIERAGEPPTEDTP